VGYRGPQKEGGGVGGRESQGAKTNAQPAVARMAPRPSVTKTVTQTVTIKTLTSRHQLYQYWTHFADMARCWPWRMPGEWTHTASTSAPHPAVSLSSTPCVNARHALNPPLWIIVPHKLFLSLSLLRRISGSRARYACASLSSSYKALSLSPRKSLGR
jgi:hypothetical protein